MQTTIPEIGKTIKELRSRLGLTLDQVAERSGCTPGFLSQVERNKAVPSITTLQAIAKALGVNVIDLFRDEVHPARLVRHDSRESFQFEGSTTTYSLLSTKFSYGRDGSLPHDDDAEPTRRCPPMRRGRTRAKSSSTSSRAPCVSASPTTSTICIRATARTSSPPLDTALKTTAASQWFS